MTEPTPRTEAGRRLIGYLTPDALALVAKAEAEAAAQARTEALDMRLRREAQAIVDTVYALGPFLDGTGDELDIEALEAAILAAKETP